MDDAARIRQLEAELRDAREEIDALRQRESTLLSEVERQTQARLEAQGQRAATADILRVIASPPTDLRAVLDTLTETAGRLLGARGAIWRIEGDHLRVAGSFRDETGRQWAVNAPRLPISRGSMAGRAVVDRTVVHVPDLGAVVSEFPDSALALEYGQRAGVCAPLIREGQAIGVISIARFELRAFTDEEMALLQSFADQAVIAIENARLFDELEQRNLELQESNRQVTEALDQQTATAEVLRVMASSPTDLDTVLQAIIETAGRLCEAPSGILGVQRERDGHLVARVAFGAARDQQDRTGGNFDRRLGLPPGRGTISGRAFLFSFR